VLASAMRVFALRTESDMLSRQLEAVRGQSDGELSISGTAQRKTKTQECKTQYQSTSRV
jgi:hypothetical protein